MDEEQSFLDFLEHEAYAKEAWNLLNKEVGQELRPCYAYFGKQSTKATDSGWKDHVTFIWNHDNFCVSIDIFEDKSFEWFVFDKETETVAGTKDIWIGDPPIELLEALRKWCVRK